MPFGIVASKSQKFGVSASSQKKFGVASPSFTASHKQLHSTKKPAVYQLPSNVKRIAESFEKIKM